MSDLQSAENVDASSVGLSRDERRIRAAQDVLRTAIRDLYLGHFNADIPTGSLSINLSLRVDPADNWRLEFNPPLTEQLMPQLADREAVRDVFLAGHVYCFRCGSCNCEHAMPPSPLHVFCGYDAAGRPEWKEFAQVLIDERDERVDQLFVRPPRLVARFQFGRALKGRQLSAFGKASLSYSILAQVVAGYFDHENGRLAITLQIVEGRNRAGELTLRLNPIGHALDGNVLLEWLSAENSAGLFRAIQIAEQELGKIEAAVIAARASGDQPRANQWMGRIPGVARGLVEALERGGRQGERRTRHVEERRRDQRPVHKAMDDAAAAKSDACFFDEKAKTFVVVGDRGRTHAFNADGKHVTSFIMKPSAVAFRVRTERWRPVQSVEWDEIRRVLHYRTAALEKESTHHEQQ